MAVGTVGILTALAKQPRPVSPFLAESTFYISYLPSYSDMHVGFPKSYIPFGIILITNLFLYKSFSIYFYINPFLYKNTYKFRKYRKIRERSQTSKTHIDVYDMYNKN